MIATLVEGLNRLNWPGLIAFCTVCISIVLIVWILFGSD